MQTTNPLNAAPHAFTFKEVETLCTEYGAILHSGVSDFYGTPTRWKKGPVMYSGLVLGVACFVLPGPDGIARGLDWNAPVIYFCSTNRTVWFAKKRGLQIVRIMTIARLIQKLREHAQKVEVVRDFF